MDDTVRITDRMGVRKGNAVKVLLVLLALVAAEVLFAGFPSGPILYADDWPLIAEKHLNGTLDLVDPGAQRPLEEWPYALFLDWLGAPLPVLPFAAAVINILCALLFYLVLRSDPPGIDKATAAFAALILLVHPLDITHTWLTTINPRVALALLLLSFLLAASRIRSGGSRAKLFASLFTLLLSLLHYEAGMGLAAIWSLLLLWRSPREKRRFARSGFLSTLLILLLFGIFRLVAPAPFYQDRLYASYFSADPVLLLSHLIKAVRIHISSIVEPLASASGMPGIWIAVIAATAIILIAVTGFIRSRRNTETAFLLRQRYGLLFIGAVLCFAGLVPTLFFVGPSTDGANARLMLFSLPGAAILLAGIVALLSGTKAKSLIRRSIMFLLMLLFLLPGYLRHGMVREDNRRIHREEIRIWRSVFSKVPVSKDSTFLILQLPAQKRENNWQRTPIIYNGAEGIAAQLRLFYDNPTVDGIVTYGYGDISLTQEHNTAGAQERVLVLRYDTLSGISILSGENAMDRQEQKTGRQLRNRLLLENGE